VSAESSFYATDLEGSCEPITSAEDSGRSLLHHLHARIVIYCDCESSSPKSPQSYDVFLTLPMCCHSLHWAPRQVLPAAASLSRVADAWAASLATRQLHKNNIAIENGHL